MSFDLTTVTLAAAIVGLWGAVCGLIVGMRSGVREREKHRRELGRLREKVEILTAPSTARYLSECNTLFSELLQSLPAVVKRQAGAQIFDIESRILTRLAELEPDLRRDPHSRGRMNELIESMESLEGAVCTIAAETLQGGLQEAHKRILEGLLPLGDENGQVSLPYNPAAPSH